MSDLPPVGGPPDTPPPAQIPPQSQTLPVALDCIREASCSPAHASMTALSPAALVDRALAGTLEQLPVIHKPQSFFPGIDVFMNPGLIQDRAYIHATEPLFDLYLDEHEKQLPLAMKAQIATRRAPPTLKPLYLHLAAMFQPRADIYALREAFFKELEVAYNSDLYKQGGDFAQSLRQIGYTIFTATPMHTFGEDAARVAMAEGKRAPIDYQAPLSEILENDRKAIEKATPETTGGTGFAAKEKWRGHTNDDFEPTHRNNPHQHLFSVTYDVNGQDQTAECLRFGTPTMERPGSDRVEISPAFRLFLDECQQRGEKVLSFQLQNPDPKAGNAFGGQESQRLQAVKDLAGEYPGILDVIALPMDGAFFKGKGDYEGLATMRQFKATFKEKLRDPGLFHLPDNSLSEIDEIIDRVAQLHFPGAEERMLSARERQIFQMITYAYIEQYFIAKENPKYYHSQCKDAMDRAMSLNVILHFLNLQQVEQEKEPTQVEDIRTLVHAAPLIIKGVGMHGDRFRLMKDVLDHLEQHPVREQRVVEGVNYRRTQIQRKASQTVSVSPSGARDRDDYVLRMRRERTHHFAQDSVSSPEEAQGICTNLMKSRYVAPDIAIGLSKPTVSGNTMTFHTGAGQTIEATLNLDRGYLTIDWNVT